MPPAAMPPAATPADTRSAPEAGRRTSTGRPRVFRGIAGLLTLGMALTGGHLLVTSWTDGTDGGGHRLQGLHWGVAEGLLLAVALGVQLRRPHRHPAAMRVAVLAVVAQLIVAVAAGSPDPFGLVLAALVGTALAVHPARRQVLRPAWVADPLTLIPAALTAACLLAFAAVQVANHYAAAPGDPLEAMTGWIGAAIAATGLALVLLDAAVTRSRAAAFLAGAGLAVLGVASVLFPAAPSSFGTAGGVAALVVAVAALTGAVRLR